MRLTKEIAEMLDNFFNYFISYRNKYDTTTLPFNIYLGDNSNVFDYKLRGAFIVALYYQSKSGFVFFAFDGDSYVTMVDGRTEAFLESGGFTAIFEDEEKLRQLKNELENSAIKANISVIETNEITKESLKQQSYFTHVIMWSTVATALIAGLSLLKDLKCNGNKQSVKVEVQVKYPTQLPLSAKDTSQNHSPVLKKTSYPKK